MEAYIYGLVSPLSGQLRYVGRAVDMRARYASHISQSLAGREFTPVNIWIEWLNSIDAWPVMRSLERLQADDRETLDLLSTSAESRAIQRAVRKHGASLLNSSNGHRLRRGQLMRAISNLHRIHREAGEQQDWRLMKQCSRVIQGIFCHEPKLVIHEQGKIRGRSGTWPPEVEKDYQAAAQRRHAKIGLYSSGFDDAGTEGGTSEESGCGIGESAGSKGQR